MGVERVVYVCMRAFSHKLPLSTWLNFLMIILLLCLRIYINVFFFPLSVAFSDSGEPLHKRTRLMSDGGANGVIDSPSLPSFTSTNVREKYIDNFIL